MAAYVHVTLEMSTGTGGGHLFPMQFLTLLLLKEHSQLCDCADLDTSFSHFEKSSPHPEIKVHLEFRVNLSPLLFCSLYMNLFFFYYRKWCTEEEQQCTEG